MNETSENRKELAENKPPVKNKNRKPAKRRMPSRVSIFDVSRYYMYHRKGSNGACKEPISEKLLSVIVALLQGKFMEEHRGIMLFVPTDWKVADKMLHFKELHNEIFRNKKTITSHSQIFWRIVKPKGKEGKEHQKLNKLKREWLDKTIAWIDGLTLKQIAEEFNKHLDFFAKTKVTPEVKKCLKKSTFNWSMPLEDQKKRQHKKKENNHGKYHHSQHRPKNTRMDGVARGKNNGERVLPNDGQRRDPKTTPNS